jgi:chromosome segregation ATPase
MSPLIVALIGAVGLVVGATVGGIFTLSGAIVQVRSKPSRSEQRMAALSDRNDELESAAVVDWQTLRECEDARRAAEDAYYDERTGRRIANRELELAHERHRAELATCDAEIAQRDLRIASLEAQIRRMGREPA